MGTAAAAAAVNPYARESRGWWEWEEARVMAVYAPYTRDIFDLCGASGGALRTVAVPLRSIIVAGSFLPGSKLSGSCDSNTNVVIEGTLRRTDYSIFDLHPVSPSVMTEFDQAAAATYAVEHPEYSALWVLRIVHDAAAPTRTAPVFVHMGGPDQFAAWQAGVAWVNTNSEFEIARVGYINPNAAVWSIMCGEGPSAREVCLLMNETGHHPSMGLSAHGESGATQAVKRHMQIANIFGVSLPSSGLVKSSLLAELPALPTLHTFFLNARDKELLLWETNARCIMQLVNVNAAAPDGNIWFDKQVQNLRAFPFADEDAVAGLLALRDLCNGNLPQLRRLLGNGSLTCRVRSVANAAVLRRIAAQLGGNIGCAVQLLALSSVAKLAFDQPSAFTDLIDLLAAHTAMPFANIVSLLSHNSVAIIAFKQQRAFTDLIDLLAAHTALPLVNIVSLLSHNSVARIAFKDPRAFTAKIDELVDVTKRPVDEIATLLSRGCVALAAFDGKLDFCGGLRRVATELELSMQQVVKMFGHDTVASLAFKDITVFIGTMANLRDKLKLPMDRIRALMSQDTIAKAALTNTAVFMRSLELISNKVPLDMDRAALLVSHNTVGGSALAQPEQFIRVVQLLLANGVGDRQLSTALRTGIKALMSADEGTANAALKSAAAAAAAGKRRR